MRRITLLTMFIVALVTGSLHAQLTGAKTIPGDYATITLAVQDLNTQGVGAGGVTFNVAAGYTETITARINLTATGTSANPIVFQKSGAGLNPVITAFVGTATPASATPDGIWSLQGSDYVTIDGIDLVDPNAANPATMEYGYGLFKNSATDGAQNNTIKNCTITLNRVNNANSSSPMVEGSVGILLINATPSAATTALTPTAATGTNSSNHIYTNTIQNCNYGIALSGYAASSPFTLGDTGNDIGGTASATGNTILNYGGGGTANPAAAIRANNEWSINISWNTINNNNGSGVNHGTTLRGIYAQAGTSANADITHNTVTVNGGATTSALYGIENGIGSTAASNTVNITFNTIQNCTYSTATSANFNGILNGASAATVNINNNTVTASNIPGTGTISMINSGASATTLNMNNNTVTNNTASGTGTTLQLIIATSSPTNTTINNNTITGNQLTGGNGTFYCIKSGTSVYTVSGNTVNNNSIPSTTGTSSSSLYGYYNLASPTGETITNNTFSNLSIGGTTTSTGSTVAGIYTNTTSSSVKNWTGNQIFNLTSAPAATCYGIYSASANTIAIAKNKIYGISSGGASGAVNGIYLSSGTTATISNNYVGDLTTPASTSGTGVIGINIQGSTNSNIYYNTVYLSAASSGTGFGSAGIYASTSPSVDMRNNLVVNLSTATGTGLTAAYRRSGTTLSSYASASNNNSFYAGAPSAANLIYYDGTNSDQTLAAYKTRVTPRDAASFTVNPTFVSTTGSSAQFLHIPAATVTPLESGGTVISGLTTDYDNDARPGPVGSINGGATAPDIGADEFDGGPALPVINSVSASPSGTQCVATARTITANVTPISPLTSVTLNYSFNAVAQTPITMTGGNPSATSNWTATLPAATPVNATVTWSVTATDGTLSTSATGTSYSDAPTVGLTLTASATPSTVCAGSPTTLKVTASKSGSVTLGAGASTASSYESPFYHLFGGLKDQFLVKASELTALGLSAGNITALGLDVTTGGGTYNSFEVNIASVGSTSALTTTLVNSGFNTVYSAASYTPVANSINTITFSTPFNWDGVSNIVIQFCWSNNNSGGTSNYVKYDAQSFVCHAYYRADNQTPAVLCSTTAGTSTSSNRPKFIFTGNTASTPTAFSWSDGSTTVGTTNPLSYSPSATATYTCSATYSGCPITSTGVTVTVNPLPTAPTATNSNQCGVGVPTASVASAAGPAGNGTFNWYAASTGGTALQSSTSTTYTTSVSATTTFYVSESGTNGCESPRTPVTVTVATPDPVSAVSTPTAVCIGASISLSSANTASSPVNVYNTFSWSSTAGSGASSPVSGNPVTVTPTATGTYVYTVVATETSTGCSSSNTISVAVNALPPVPAPTATPSTVCAGGAVNLNMTATQNLLTETFETFPLTQFTVTGTGVTAAQNTTYFQQGASSVRMQYTASADGAIAMSSNMNLTGYSSATLTFQHICATEASWDFGYVQYSLDGGATWNSFPTSSYTGAGALRNSVVSFDKSSYSDWGTQLSSSSATPTNALWKLETIDLTPYVGNSQFRIRFRETSDSGVQYYGWLIDNVVVTATPTQTYSWTSSPAGFTSSVQNPTANPTVTTTYNAIVTGATGCTSTAPVTVTVLPLPAAPTATNSNQCGVGIPTASVASAAGPAGNGTFNWYAAATGGSPLQSGTSTTYTTTVSTTTTFYVSESGTNTCESPRTPVTVTVATPDPVSAASTPTVICLGTSITLNSANTAASPVNTYNSFSWSSAAGSGASTPVSGSTATVTPTAAGAYTYTVTATETSTGCAASNTIAVTVNALPATPTFTNPTPSMCVGGAATQLKVNNFATSVAASTQTATVASGTLSLAIPDNNLTTGVSTNLTLSGIPANATITGIAVGFNINHTWDSDLRINVKAPSGDVLCLANSVGSSGDNFTNTVVSSSASTPIGSGSAPFTGTFQPSGTTGIGPAPYTSNIASFTPMLATPANGTWTLWVGDGASSDVGTINSWNVTVTYTVPVNNITWSAVTNLFNDAAATIAYTGTSQNPVYGNPSTTTTYTVTVTDANSCTSSAPVTLTVNPLPTVTATAANSTICTGSSTTLTGSGATTYSWMPGSLSGTTVTVSPTASTTYTVTGTNASGCTNTATVAVTVNPLPTVATTSTLTTICNGNSTSITGSGANTYLWNPGALTGTTITVSPTTTTTYTVTGTDGNGCTNTSTRTITVNPLPNVTATAGNAAICTGNNTTLTGNGATSYSWMPGSLSGTTVTVSPTTATTYTVTGTDANSCTSTATVTVNVNALPTVAASTTTSTICAGNPASLSATGATTYNWMPGSLSGASVTTSPSTTTTYTVTGTDANNCSSTSTVTVNVNALPTVTASTTTSTICAGNTASLTANGATSYSWMPGSLSGAAVTDVPSATTTYTVTGTDANSCSNTATVTVNVNALPNVTASTTTAAICVGNTASLDATGASTYSWMPGSLSGASVTDVPSATTTYTVTGTDANTCSNTATVTVTVNALPNVTASTTTSTICAGNTASLDATGATTYNWMPGSLSGASVTDTPSATTTYTVTGTDANNCSSTSTVTVNVNALPTVAASTTTAAICAGNTASLDATGSASSYVWMPGSLNGASVTDVPSATTTYTVTGTDANNCSSSATVTVTVNPLPVVTLSSPATHFCTGGSVTLTGNSGGNSQWYLNGVAISGATSATYVATTPGVYNMMDTNGNGCSDSAAVGITITEDALPVVSLGNDVTQCGGTVTLDAQNPGESYLWSDNSANQTLTASAIGIYWVDVTNAAGCTTRDSITVTINATPVVNLGADQAICSGTVTLDAQNAGDSYLWNDNTINQTLTATTSGIYWVDVTNSFGCTTRDSVTITINTNPVVALGNDVAQCGGTVTLDAQNAGATYLWNDSTTNQTLTVSSSGTYFVTVTYTGGCSASDTINVTINTPPTVTFAMTPDSICVNDAPLSLVGAPAGGAFSGPGVTGSNFDPASLNGLQTITYTYTDVNGCTGTATDNIVVDACTGIVDPVTGGVNINVYPNPNLGVFTIDLGYVPVSPVQIDITNSIGQLVQSFQMTGTTKQVDLGIYEGGLYMVRITDGNSVTVVRVVKQ